MPTLTAQFRREFLIHAEKDGQEIFDSLAAQTKELLWIEQSNQRFYAYNPLRAPSRASPRLVQDAHGLAG